MGCCDHLCNQDKTSVVIAAHLTQGPNMAVHCDCTYKVEPGNEASLTVYTWEIDLNIAPGGTKSSSQTN